MGASPRFFPRAEFSPTEPGASARPLTVGVKIRLGGDFVPSADELASFIENCTESNSFWKATAGLHQPFAHDGQHGFLNVFLAAVLSYVHRPPRETLVRLLGETSAERFHFAEEFVSWNGLRATCDEIASARRQSLTSFGSCSFEEPRDHVRRLLAGS